MTIGTSSGEVYETEFDMNYAMVSKQPNTQLAAMDEDVKGGKVIRPQFGGGIGKPSEPRETHTTPYSKLSPEDQAIFREKVTDPKLREMLGIPEGTKGDVITFKPK